MEKKNVIFGVIGILVGIILTGIIMFSSAQSMMLKEEQLNMSFNEAAELLEKTTKDKGWKIPVVHDLQETMSNFGKDVNKAKVFELCHPDHAYKILREDDERIVSSLMPCRISIYEKSDGRVYISWMNTSLMGRMMKGVVPEVMGNASRESEEIINVLLSK